jgi:hypothetical protein
MTKKQSTKKGGKKGKAAGSKGKLTAEQKAQAEQFKKNAVAYAKTAYDAALAHYEANQGNPFTLSRLAVVYEESKPGDLHMVVTLPNVVNKATSEAEARQLVKDAELIARTLEHEGCTEAFEKACEVIYTEHILQGSDVSWTTPAVLRVMLPLALLNQWREHDGSGVPPLEIIQTLSCELVPDEVDREVRASLGMQ